MDKFIEEEDRHQDAFAKIEVRKDLNAP